MGLHLASCLLLVWGLADILINLSDFRAVPQSPQPVPEASEAGLGILYGSAVGMYLTFVALTPFPKLYNYPFKLKPGEERLTFPPSRAFANFLAAQSVLLLLLINFDMIRVVAHNQPSMHGWTIGVLLSVMSATTVYYRCKLLRLHAPYTPPPDDAESLSA